MTDPVIAFVPCRKGSTRVVGKNTRTFGDVTGGLTQIKLMQLMSCSAIDRIVVSTDDEAVVAIAETLAGSATKPIDIFRRDPDLAADNTSTDALVLHVPDIIPDGVVLWTHVTSPFLDADQYGSAVATYRDTLQQGTHDSLMSVTRLQTFIWDKSGPINYDRGREKWPATQSLPAYYEVNSGIFLIAASLMRSVGDRIGGRPYLFETSHLSAFDIDTESQFELGSQIWLANKHLS